MNYMETECSKTTKHQASVSEQFSDEGVTYFEDLAIEGNRAQACGIVVARDGSDDPLYGGSPAEDWAKERVTRFALRASIHFLSVLLVFEYDGDILG